MKTEAGNSILFEDFGAQARVQTSDEYARPGHDGAVASRGRGGKTPLRVLVADDCRDTADSLATLVKIWGHQVWVAYDGEAALEGASAIQADVLVLDIAMPKMDGYRVARQIRRQASSTLVIAVTGWADQTHRLFGHEAGFDRYLIKPVSPSTIKTLLAVEQGRLVHRAPTRFATSRALAIVGND